MARTRKRKPSRGWRTAAPRTVEERRALYRRCGPSAFLEPDRYHPGYSAFPVMSKRTTTCSYDCRGLLAAMRRADQYGHRGVAKKARRAAVRAGCPWAR